MNTPHLTKLEVGFLTFRPNGRLTSGVNTLASCFTPNPSIPFVHAFGITFRKMLAAAFTSALIKVLFAERYIPRSIRFPEKLYFGHFLHTLE